MVIKMIEDSNIKETKITIECSKADSNVLKLISLINSIDNTDRKIIGISKGETYCIEIVV